MKRVKWIALGMLWTGMALAGRPLFVDDAGTAGRGHVEVEGGMGWSHASDSGGWDIGAALTLGVTETLDIGAGFGYQWSQPRAAALGEDESDWSDLGVGAKWQFATQDDLLLDHALAFTVVIPVADEDTGLGSGHPAYDLTWIGTRQIAEQWAADVNVGYTYTSGSDDGESLPDYLHYGVALRYALNEQWEPVAEVFAETTTDDEHETTVFGDIGIRYRPSERVQFDAALGTTLSGEGPDVFVTAGFTLYS